MTLPRHRSASHQFLLFAFLIALAIPSVAPVRSYDYFWHLATGRWIVDNGRLPAADPFAVASDRERWINGEWLFQLGLYGAYAPGGHDGMSILRAVAVAALFTLVFLLSWRLGPWSVALLLTVVCWYGADHRLTARPEAAATFLVVVCCWLTLERPTVARTAMYVVLTALWINLHPSALLSPIIAACGLPSLRGRGEIVRRGVTIAGAAAALLANPYGFEGVLAPLRLMRTIGERRFVNLEWLPSLPGDFPLLYAVIATGVVLFVLAGRRQHLSAALLFAVFAYLAIRHVRNQGFFFAVTPLLVAPAVPEVKRRALRRLFPAAAAVLWAVIFAARIPLRTGVDQALFPVRAVERLRTSGIGGNILNSDQFGGYLIWTFYPERRVLIDGRNELFDTYLREYDRARGDAREWAKLLEKYNVAVAVDEHHRNGIETIDAVTGQRHTIPVWQAYFPPRRWAVIAVDEVAAVFARRDKVPPALLERLELRAEKFPQ